MWQDEFSKNTIKETKTKHLDNFFNSYSNPSIKKSKIILAEGDVKIELFYNMVSVPSQSIIDMIPELLILLFINTSSSLFFWFLLL